MAASQAEMKKRLKVLMNKAENQICSDCPERQPRWASLIVPPPGSPPGTLPMGAFCCLECSGSHRRLGVHISFVRSVNLDSWKEKEVLAMENGGNKKVNAIFEARLAASGATKPTTHADGQTRERFIRDKYERRKYFDGTVLQEYEESEEEEEEEERAPPVRRAVVAPSRAPSDAARRRVESRQARLSTDATVAPPKVSAVAAPHVDLLDFGAFTESAPAPVAAAPTPNLDLFADMMINSAPPPANGNMAPAPAAPARTTNDQILAMFSSMPQQHQQQQPAGMHLNNGMMASNSGMMMGGMMPQQNNDMMGGGMSQQNNNMMMMQNNGFGNMTHQQQAPPTNNMMMHNNGYGNMMQQQQQPPPPSNMMMHNNGFGNMMQQQQPPPSNNMMPMMMQHQSNMPMVVPQQLEDTAMMRMMQQESNSDGFGFPQAPMGSGPPISVHHNGNGHEPVKEDPFSQFGMTSFRF